MTKETSFFTETWLSLSYYASCWGSVILRLNAPSKCVMIYCWSDMFACNFNSNVDQMNVTGAWHSLVVLTYLKATIAGKYASQNISKK